MAKITDGAYTGANGLITYNGSAANPAALCVDLGENSGLQNRPGIAPMPGEEFNMTVVDGTDEAGKRHPTYKLGCGEGDKIVGVPLDRS